MNQKKFSIAPRCTAAGAALYLLTAVAVVFLDRLSKNYIVENLPLYGTQPGIPYIFELTYVRNTGAAWSMLSGHTNFLGWLSALAVVGIFLYIAYGRLCPAARLCLAAVAGGAIGNCVDRFNLGYVIDMINLSFMSFPVFNVADSFIVACGIAFSLLFLFYNDKYLVAHGLMTPEEAGMAPKAAAEPVREDINAPAADEIAVEENTAESGDKGNADNAES